MLFTWLIRNKCNKNWNAIFNKVFVIEKREKKCKRMVLNSLKKTARFDQYSHLIALFRFWLAVEECSFKRFAIEPVFSFFFVSQHFCSIPKDVHFRAFGFVFEHFLCIKCHWCAIYHQSAMIYIMISQICWNFEFKNQWRRKVSHFQVSL